MLTLETDLKAKGYKLIIGIDEAGRGPLAGPVVAAAVVLQQQNFSTQINDSKKLTPKQRLNAFQEISDNNIFGIGIMAESIIDDVNILQATFLAMTRAVEQLIIRLPENMRVGLNPQDVCLLVDGPYFKSDLPYHVKTIVDGDANVLSIACASILAKVTRDRILEGYDQIFPQYGFKKHKGYPTAAHRLAIRTHGLCPIHRRSFSAVGT